MNDILWFAFFLIRHMEECCGAQSHKEATKMAIASMNVIIFDHNEAVYKQQCGSRYYLNTGSYSDNQCVFSTMLRRDTTYKPIDNYIF